MEEEKNSKGKELMETSSEETGREELSGTPSMGAAPDEKKPIVPKNEKLAFIQHSLVNKKTKFNCYSGFLYRTVSGILQSLKPVLSDAHAAIILDDEVCLIGTRFYIKATAKLYDSDDGKQLAAATGWAREPESEKGKSASQITGGASTYARKVALCGLLAIDDGDEEEAQVITDPDRDNHESEASAKRLLSQKIKNSGFPAKEVNLLVFAMTNGVYQSWRDLTEEASEHILAGDWGVYCLRMSNALRQERENNGQH